MGGRVGRILDLGNKGFMSPEVSSVVYWEENVHLSE